MWIFSLELLPYVAQTVDLELQIAKQVVEAIEPRRYPRSADRRWLLRVHGEHSSRLPWEKGIHIFMLPRQDT